MRGILNYLLGLSVLCPFIVKAQTEAQIFTDYKTNPATSILPNFSYVGYKNGTVPIDYTGKNLQVFDVTNYGAVADDNTSDKTAIKAAITAAQAANGGIVFFPSGRFIVQDATDDATEVYAITKSNIILKGSGSGTGGTELFMKTPMDPKNASQYYSCPSLFTIGSGSAATALGGFNANAAVGDFDINLVNVTGLVAGDWLLFEMRSDDATSLKLDLGNYAVNPNWTSLKDGGVDVSFVLQINQINGNTVTLKQPLPYPITKSLPWVVSKYKYVEEMGVEDIAFVGNFKKTFEHHGSALDDSGYSLIQFKRLVNSWMRNCRFTDVSVAASIGISGANITIDNCSITGNGGHEAINNAGATNVLISNINDQAGQWHSVGVSKTSMNTVLYKVTYPATTCFESHSSQPRNTLLDNVTGGLTDGRAGGDIKEMPNHMRNLVFWNYKKTNSGNSPFDFWPSNNIYFKIPYPIVVGMHGQSVGFISSQLKYEESTGAAVSPASLYQAQLAFRLNETSTAFGTWAAQSNIYNYDLGTNTGTGGVFSSGSSESVAGPPAQQGYLPAPPSGTAKVQVNGTNGDGGSFTLNQPLAPSVPNIEMKATSASPLIKLSAYDIANASEIASMFFNIAFNSEAVDGIYVWALGNKNAGGSLFSSASGVFKANTELFTSFEWTIKSTAIDFKFRESADGNVATRALISSTAFAKGVNYAVEVYANNSSVSKSYMRNSQNYAVPAGCFHLWINGVQFSYNSTYNFPQSKNSTNQSQVMSELAQNTKLDAYLFQASKSTGNNAVATISNIKLAYNTSTLPVTFLSFDGKSEENGIRLSWKTASELNNHRFEILRATDGKNFQTIGSVSGKGNSQQVTSYNYLDREPETGINYYRLKQIDKDGTESIFQKIVAVENALRPSERLSVFADNSLLKAKFYASTATIANFALSDLNGKRLISQNFNSNKGANELTLLKPMLAPGIYIATLTQNGTHQSVKLLIQ